MRDPVVHCHHSSHLPAELLAPTSTTARGSSTCASWPVLMLEAKGCRPVRLLFADSFHNSWSHPSRRVVVPLYTGKRWYRNVGRACSMAVYVSLLDCQRYSETMMGYPGLLFLGQEERCVVFGRSSTAPALPRSQVHVPRLLLLFMRSLHCGAIAYIALCVLHTLPRDGNRSGEAAWRACRLCRQRCVPGLDGRRRSSCCQC